MISFYYWAYGDYFWKVNYQYDIKYGIMGEITSTAIPELVKFY